MTAQPFDAMAMIDAMQETAQTMTGFKNTFINQGWSEKSAEQMVIELLKQASGAQK